MDALRASPLPLAVSVPAPAKINLFLHVIGRRADGYHLLQTAFRLLEHGDSLHLLRRDDGEIRRLSGPAAVAPEHDLTLRAARLLQARSGCRYGVDITLTKRLPLGGGLGGGSSDAASTLLGLNRLWALGLDRATLQRWALELGADVPFFVFGRSAFAEGVGEALQPLTLPSAWYAVAEPEVQVPTAEIFSAPDLTRSTEPIIISGFTAGSCGSELRNDLQAVACKRYPQVAQALALLSECGATLSSGPAQMSGSGACVFLPCAGRAEAQQVARQVSERGLRCWAAAGLDVHPLHDWAS